MAMPCPKSCSELLLDKPQALHTDKDLSSLFTTPRKLFLVKHLFYNPGINNKPMKENKTKIKQEIKALNSSSSSGEAGKPQSQWSQRNWGALRPQGMVP